MPIVAKSVLIATRIGRDNIQTELRQGFRQFSGTAAAAAEEERWRDDDDEQIADRDNGEQIADSPVGYRWGERIR